MLIAERHLRLGAGENTINIPICIFSPEKIDDMDVCRYTIGWPNGERKSYAAGVDSVQAMQLVLQKIGIEIYSSPYHKSSLLYWEAPGQGYGFPVQKNSRDLLVGDDKVFDG